MKTETRTVFIADDGTEFKNQGLAEQHEHFLRIVNLLDVELPTGYAETAARILVDNGTYRFKK